jgi:vacuolar-type H+-ATPase subunit E/Vma4
MALDDVESRFLRSIDKYARWQQSKMEEEIREIERVELEKTERRAIEDVNNMIQKELQAMKSRIEVDVSHAELECRKNLAKKRKEMLLEIFKICGKQLLDCVFSEEYSEILKKCAKNIAKVLDAPDAELFVKEGDLKFSDIIKKNFARECTVSVDNEIEIGGICGFSRSLGIVADDTLDASLETQKDWFIQKYGSKLIY